MNTTPQSAAELARGIVDGTAGIAGVTTIICPPFVSLQAVKSVIDGSDVSVGAQNVSAEPSGAYTGEVSVGMLAGLATYVIVGHSERRSLYGETDDDVAGKAVAVAAGGLKPIVCVGESLEVRRAGDAEEVSAGDRSARALPDIPPGNPLWWLTNRFGLSVPGRLRLPATRRQLRGPSGDELSNIAGQAHAGQIPVLYGGSVNPENAGPFVDRPDVDGALVGGASLQADDFSAIVRVTAGLAVK